MKTYRLDDINFTGGAEDLIRYLHKASRAQAINDEAWMEEVAKRTKMVCGSQVRHDTAEHFVDDMIKVHQLDARRMQRGSQSTGR